MTPPVPSRQCSCCSQRLQETIRVAHHFTADWSGRALGQFLAHHPVLIATERAMIHAVRHRVSCEEVARCSAAYLDAWQAALATEKGVQV